MRTPGFIQKMIRQKAEDKERFDRLSIWRYLGVTEKEYSQMMFKDITKCVKQDCNNLVPQISHVLCREHLEDFRNWQKEQVKEIESKRLD